MTRSYAIPPGTRLYAIGDVHGHRGPVAAMLEKIAEDVRGRHIPNVKVVFLGDYIDRGPDSAGMLDDLIALPDAGWPFEFVFLKGNHENGMLAFMDNPEGERRDWLHWGGVETLASYHIYPNDKKPLSEQVASLAQAMRKTVPAAHIGFMNSLRLHYQCGDYLCVHAGVRPNFPLSEQRKEDLWMIRDGFLDYDGLHPWRVVHGHTITKEPEILPARINVDTGLYKYGVLSCAVLEGQSVGIMQVRA